MEEERSKLPTSVLFCGHQNSVLSAMAEGLMKEFYGHEVYVQSAGVQEEHGIDGFSVAVCAELGVNIERLRSRSLNNMEEWGDDLSGFDLVVALDPAAQRRLLEYTRLYHLEVEYWSILNPSDLGELRDEKLEAYRNSRDQIIRRMEERFGPRLTPSAENPADVDKHPNDEHDQLLEEINERLSALEEYIRPIVSAKSMIGHNNPPNDQEIDEPFDGSDWLDIQEAIGEIRSAVLNKHRSDEDFFKPIETLEAKSGKLSQWIGVRATKVVDATLVAVGTALGASIVIDPARLLDLTNRLITSIQSFLTSAPLP